MKRAGRLAGILAAVVVAGGITVASAGTARADVVPPSGTWSEIVAGYLDQEACLDDPGGANQTGDPLELWHCHGYDSRGSAQQWNFALISIFNPPLYSLYSPSPSHCLGVNDTTLRSGDRLVLVKCFFGAPYWNVLSRNAYPGDPAFELEYGQTGYCMTMPDWSGGNAEPVLIRPCQPGNGLQLWNIG
jgi:Ricin-type beta-trefoil lectin domain